MTLLFNVQLSANAIAILRISSGIRNPFRRPGGFAPENVDSLNHTIDDSFYLEPQERKGTKDTRPLQ